MKKLKNHKILMTEIMKIAKDPRIHKNQMKVINKLKMIHFLF